MPAARPDSRRPDSRRPDHRVSRRHEVHALLERLEQYLLPDEAPAPAPLPFPPERMLLEPPDQEADQPADLRALLLLTRLDELSDDVLLSPEEAATILDRSKFTLRHWRIHEPNHPLRWLKYGRRIKYRCGDVKSFARGERPRPQPPARRRSYRKPEFAPATK